MNEMISYDYARFMNLANVKDAIDVIVGETEGMSSEQRWAEETPVLMRIMANHVRPRSVVLDYGCGIGRLAKPLIEQLGCSVLGVDASPAMRAMANSYVGSPNFLAVDPATFGEMSARFDAAIAVWALQHCLDLDHAISQITRSLLPGGNLIVVNGTHRSLPVQNGEWIDDGQDVDGKLRAVLSLIEHGRLDVSIAPGWMQEGVFWAAYQKATIPAARDGWW